MSRIICQHCGVWRSAFQVFAEDGWHNPPCWNCGAAGWIEPDHDWDAKQPPPPPAGAPQ